MQDQQFEQLARGIVAVALATAGLPACGGAETAPAAEPPITQGSTAEGAPVATAPEEVASVPLAEPVAPTKPEVILPPEKLPENSPQGDQCAADGGLRVIAGLRPAKPVDYISLRMTHDASAPAGVRDHLGKPCAGAQDRALCSGQLAAVASKTGFRVGCRPGYCAHLLVYTRGNKVGVVDSAAGLRQFLGPIDTESDALLLAWADGHNPGECSALSKNLKATKGGYTLTTTKMTKDCPIETSQFRLKVKTDGEVQVLGKFVKSRSGACVGRQPAGFELAESSARDAVGRYLATCAQLEEAAVAAFAQLGGELARLGAPLRLRQGAERARVDEVRHTQAVAGLSRSYGVEPEPAQVAPTTEREVIDVALENAVEGCVRETFGALVGLWQAERALDPDIREVMTEVAGDELRHAALSWQVAGWFESRLTEAERQRVARAQAAAVSQLATECDEEPDPRLVSVAGLPTAEQSRELLRQVQSRLFSAGASRARA